MIQYRVRPITRYVVTRFESHDDGNGRESGGSSERGQYDNAQIAFEVASALCKAEHDAAGTPPDDPNFIYPRQEDMFPDIRTMSDSAGTVMSAVQSA